MTVRVLVVDDSPTVRGRLVEVLGADPDLEVVGEGADGKQAIELCRSLRPDVVTLDMMMPSMTGLAATEYIMAYCPTPILIISSSTNRRDLFKMYDALAAGAVDVLEKPAGDATDEAWERKLLSTVKLVARIKVITHPRAKLAPLPAPAVEKPASGRYRFVAMGASTGGPAAVLRILKSLPATYPLPILLVIHIGRLFAVGLAEWLDSQSPLRVAYATDGEPLPEPGRGRVILAPPDRHLVVERSRLRLSAAPERHSCRPSVDVLFESAAREWGERTIGCLLTGMGKDGAQGLLEMRQAGGWTTAQDKESSVVYGMPFEAAQRGAAGKILSLDEMAPALTDLAEAGS
ncbi:MAG TPA: chemotaxis-specific protein-glutamate methyltransferase CheB [Planctomycetota bacterium]